MSQSHPSLASSRNATEPTRSVQPAAQHFSYPFVLCDKQAPDTMQGHFNALSEMPVGFFPLATSGLANGSLHFGKEATGFLVEKGFRCLADGEVVAYKLDSKLQKLVYGPNEVVFYSLGFVLVRHRLVLPQATQREATTEDRSIAAPAAAADADDGAYIFSLYSYNRAFRDYPVDRDDFLLESVPFWQGSHRYRVGNRANDRQLTVPEAFAQEHIAQGVSEIYTIMPEWLTPAIDPYTKNTVTVPPPEPAVGLRVREHGRATARVIGLLPRDCILTVRGTSTSGWAQIAAFERGNPLPHVVEGNFSKHPIADGWIFLGELDHTVMPSPLDKVLVLDDPHPVKAGDLLGYLGENPGRDLAEEEDAPPRRRPRVAIEVFAGNDFPAHLAEARRRAADLPDSEKTVLIIERGAKLCEQARSPEHIVDRWHYIVPHAKSPKTGPYVCGTVYGAESVATNIPLDFGDYRASAKGDKRIDSETYNELKAAKQSAYPTVLKPVRELGFCWGHRRHEIGGRYMSLWTRPPLVPTEGTVVATFARSFSRAELDALPEERRFVDYDGSHWWQVFIAVDGNQSKLGWVRDRNHPDTRWESPHAWPGFEVVDGSMFEPMEALMRIVCIEGDVHPTHEESFRPVATALSKSEMIVKLEEAIDHAGTLDGAVTAEDIEEARRTPWLAHGLSRLICRFQSQWSPDIERWSKLMPYMDTDWLVEMERQKERGWWGQVAGKVEGFPEDPHVYHVHPFGWVDNFSSSVRRHPRITVAGTRVELSFLSIPNDEPLTREDFADAANHIGCEPEAIQAVAMTETSSLGAFFAPGAVHAIGDDRVPSILYERHIFHECTRGLHDDMPDISSRSPYGGDEPHGPYSAQYPKLLKAFSVNRDAALKAASWGRFQILGKNHLVCGYETAMAFVVAQSESERNQLDSFVAFIKAHRGLQEAIRRKDWTKFAEGYNGPRQRTHHYDRRMAKNYEDLKNVGI